MKRPSKTVIAKLDTIFHGFTLTEGTQSPNGIPFIADNGTDKFFIKIVDKDQAAAEGLDGIETKLKELSCDTLINLIAYGDLDEHYQYLQFELIDGVDLDSVSKPVSEALAKKLILDVLNAIEELWTHGLVHRDIKPKNIMFDAAAEKYTLLDLGIGYFIEQAHRDNTKFGSGVGSRFYSAPEQILANVRLPYSISFATDLFSLGVVAYELISGDHPFKPVANSKVKNYAEAVTGAATPIHLTEYHVSNELAKTIMKLIEINPARRFLDFESIRVALGASSATENSVNVPTFIHMPHKGKEDFIQYLQHDDTQKPQGVVLNCSTADEWAEPIADLGIEIIVDPQTFKIQQNKDMANVIKKLNLPESPQYNVLDIYQLIDGMVDSTITMSLNTYATKVVLPYFNVEETGGAYVKLHREMWAKAANIKSRHLELEHKELYAGLLLPLHLVTNSDARARVLSQFQDKYDLDGIYLVIESPTSGIATITEKEYLEGVKETINFFEHIFGKVIVSRVDISALPFITNGIFATGWSKSNRHFVLNSNGRSGQYKMKWFSKELFTFIEEKSNIQIIVAAGFGDKLECATPSYSDSHQLAPTYDPSERDEQMHFYHAMKEIETDAYGLSESERRVFFKELVTNAQDNGNTIKRGTSNVITNKIIPNYEGLIALIGD